MDRPDINFEGPFPLQPHEDGQWELGTTGDCAGVYLFTVKCGDSFRIFYVGEARNIRKRMREHLTAYLAGRYWMYSATGLLAGRLDKVWEPRADTEYTLAHLLAHRSALAEMMPVVSIFVAKLDGDQSLRWRVESEIIHRLRGDIYTAAFLENHRLSIAKHDNEICYPLVASEHLYGLTERKNAK